MRVYFKASGRVQGVGFRWFVRDSALELKLSGWVRNLPGGDVEGEAQGPADKLERLLAEIKGGHDWARVTGLAQHEVPETRTGGDNFEIK
ncbi:MAG: acylphosphatase [Elusimicrobia bacterium]|nr:MAG: acylphosphatase [Elusimicrobiota bacterium]KAF0156478.1 MAG: acylphosphatase [Elusimicrobiota bacterium]